jgi:arsenate reductase-like glutaredoxin family protein
MPAQPSDPPSVQVFGRRDSRDTQKALRFFKERGFRVQFVDIAVRPPAPGELRRFAERFGEAALLDADGRRFRDLGLGYMRMDGGEALERVLADPTLLRLPLVRHGNALSIGPDEAAWKSWTSRRG